MSEEPFRWKDYTVENVYRRMSEQTRDEIVRFWVENRVLPPRIAARRVPQIVYVIRVGGGDIMGVNTVYISGFGDNREPYYFFRMFIRPDRRGSFGLMKFIAGRTYHFLKEYHDVDPMPKGIVYVMENRKFHGGGMKRWIERYGLCYYGKNERGQDIWYEQF